MSKLSSPIHTVNKHFSERFLLARQHLIIDQRWGTESHGLTGDEMPEQREQRVLSFRGGNERVWCINTQQRGQPHDGSSVSEAGWETQSWQGSGGGAEAEQSMCEALESQLKTRWPSLKQKWQQDFKTLKTKPKLKLLSHVIRKIVWRRAMNEQSVKRLQI